VSGREAMRLLQKFGPMAIDALPVLLKRLRSTDSSEAAFALTTVAPEELGPALASVLNDYKDKGENKDGIIRRTAVQLVAGYLEKEDAVRILIRAIRQGDRGLSGEAARALWELDPAACRAAGVAFH
jgi:HEAT repeat protein